MSILAVFAPLYAIVGLCLLARAFYIPVSPRHDAGFGFAIIIMGLTFQFLAAAGMGLPSDWWPILVILLLIMLGVWLGLGGRLRSAHR